MFRYASISAGMLWGTVVIGQASAGGGFEPFMPLVNIGGVGVVLFWMLWKMEPRMRSMEQTIDCAARANMLVVLALPAVTDAMKRQAQGIIDEIDERTRERKK